MQQRKDKKEQVLIDRIYGTKIRYKCPVRGIVEEEVEVKLYKSVEPPKSSDIELDSLAVELPED